MLRRASRPTSSSLLLAARRGGRPVAHLSGGSCSRRPHFSISAAAAAAAATAVAGACAAAASVPFDEVAAVSELHGQISDRPGFELLAYAYGGAERCLASFLRANKLKGKLDTSVAAERIVQTLTFRAEHGLDRTDVLCSLEAEPCRPHWPYAFSETAPNGCPVVFCRLSRLDVPRLLGSFDEERLLHFFAL
eukprot:6210423-Prymnesium_polylepis.1